MVTYNQMAQEVALLGCQVQEELPRVLWEELNSISITF
jgi:hypothetical protein